jgi:hypothetical protein
VKVLVKALPQSFTIGKRVRKPRHREGYPDLLDARRLQRQVRWSPRSVLDPQTNETYLGTLLGGRREKKGIPLEDAPPGMTGCEWRIGIFFCSEIYRYVRKYRKAGVSMEIHIRPACEHGFETPHRSESDLIASITNPIKST